MLSIGNSGTLEQEKLGLSQSDRNRWWAGGLKPGAPRARSEIPSLRGGGWEEARWGTLGCSDHKPGSDGLITGEER